MKKFLPLLAVGFLVLSGFGVVTTSGKEIKEINATMLFSKLSIQETDDHITLELDGADSQFLEKDHYIVPTQIETFTFPFGTEIISVECTPKNIQEQQLIKEIVISPEPRLMSQINSDKNNVKTENPLSVNTWYDYHIGCGIDGKERNVILKVQVFPVQYHPLENTIEWAETVEIDIKYNEASPSTNSFLETYDLIVLSPSGYSDELSSLISHKNSRGLSAKFVSLNDIYGETYFTTQGRDNPEKIKYFIKNAIENWGTTDVMLVGGIADFPARETHIHLEGDDEIFVSDLYYADIYQEGSVFCSWDSNDNDVFAEYNWGDDENNDEMDLYPDVRIGRLACTSSAEATTVVNKIKTYENNEAHTQNWFNNLVVIGGDTAPDENDDPDEEDIDEGELLNQAVIDVMDGFIPDIIWDSNGRLSGYGPTGVANINSGINSGCGFVDWSGHGAPTVWTTYPHNIKRQILPTPNPPGLYYNTYNSALNNGDKLPIVMCGGCSLGKYQANDECFTWTYLTNPNGGAIATFGATGLGYVYVGKYVTYGCVEGFMLDLYEAYDDGAITIGEMWSRAVNSYISGDMDEYDYKTLTELHMFGDPTLAIAEESLKPNTPDAPTGPSSGRPGTTYTYTASTTDIDGDEIYYLFDWDDGTFSGWVGPGNSGQTVSASHSWLAEGSYSIKVKAKDDHGVQSEWSDPLTISMPRNRATYYQLFLQILERFPNIFPILRTLLGVY